MPSHRRQPSDYTSCNGRAPAKRSAMLLWHSDLSGAGVRLSGLALKSHCRADEGIGVAAAPIIYADGDYSMSLIRAGLDTLESRRENFFFKHSVLPETSYRHYLLPDKRDVSVTGRLHHARRFELRTVKFRNSFIPYCFDRYVQAFIY